MAPSRPAGIPCLSRSTVPRSFSHFSCRCCGRVGSRKNGSSSPTGSPLLGSLLSFVVGEIQARHSTAS